MRDVIFLIYWPIISHLTVMEAALCLSLFKPTVDVAGLVLHRVTSIKSGGVISLYTWAENVDNFHDCGHPVVFHRGRFYVSHFASAGCRPVTTDVDTTAEEYEIVRDMIILYGMLNNMPGEYRVQSYADDVFTYGFMIHVGNARGIGGFPHELPDVARSIIASYKEKVASMCDDLADAQAKILRLEDDNMIMYRSFVDSRDKMRHATKVLDYVTEQYDAMYQYFTGE